MMSSADPLEMILSHIEQLREDVREGFERIDGRLTRLEERMSKVERWQAEKDAVEKAMEVQSSGQRANVKLSLSKTQVTIATIGGVIAAAAVAISIIDLFLVNVK
jgi:hypothetical protein